MQTISCEDREKTPYTTSPSVLYILASNKYACHISLRAKPCLFEPIPQFFLSHHYEAERSGITEVAGFDVELGDVPTSGSASEVDCGFVSREFTACVSLTGWAGEVVVAAPLEAVFELSIFVFVPPLLAPLPLLTPPPPRPPRGFTV